jgi:hypothetical protein
VELAALLPDFAKALLRLFNEYEVRHLIAGFQPLLAG